MRMGHLRHPKLDVRHCFMASREVPQCLTQLLAKPVGRKKSAPRRKAFRVVLCRSFNVKRRPVVIEALLLLQHPR